MSITSDTPHCNCCDEVMEELLSMRLSFEKLFYKLRKEIVGLKHEVIDVLMGTSESTNSLPPGKTLNILEPGKAKCSEKSAHTLDVRGSDTETESLQSKKVKKSTDLKEKPDKSKLERVETGLKATTPRPVLDFFNIQTRVMPTQPFRDAQQFEDWNILLRNDEDQRDQLRVELMQGNFKEPEKYVIQTWRNIFHNDAAHRYSYRGTGRDKRAIKDYIFTDIFKEIFLQRFQHMDAEFFIERTMRFFKYVRDQRRKAALKQRKLQEKHTEAQSEVQDSMDHE